MKKSRPCKALWGLSMPIKIRSASSIGDCGGGPQIAGVVRSVLLILRSMEYYIGHTGYMHVCAEDWMGAVGRDRCVGEGEGVQGTTMYGVGAWKGRSDPRSGESGQGFPKVPIHLVIYGVEMRC